MTNEAAKPTHPEAGEAPSAHAIKTALLPFVEGAFRAGLAAQGIALKDPQDATTRHAIRALFRCAAEVAAKAGWGWHFATNDAADAVINVFKHQTAAKKAAAPVAAFPLTPAASDGLIHAGATNDIFDEASEDDGEASEADADAGA